MCESWIPAASMASSPALRRPRWLFRAGQPAARGLPLAELFPRRVRDLALLIPGIAPPQITRRVLEQRGEQVVRAVHEHAGAVEQRADGVQEGGRGIAVG